MIVCVNRPNKAKEQRAIQTLNQRITLLKARLASITDKYSYYHDLRREIADWEKLREMVKDDSRLEIATGK